MIQQASGPGHPVGFRRSLGLVKVSCGTCVCCFVGDILYFGPSCGVLTAPVRSYKSLWPLTAIQILFASNHGRYDEGLVAVQSLAVFRLFGQREQFDSLRGVINTGPSFNIPTFDECLPGVPLCRVPIVNYTCSLVLQLNSLDDSSVGSAAILAEFEAQGQPR